MKLLYGKGAADLMIPVCSSSYDEQALRWVLEVAPLSHRPRRSAENELWVALKTTQDLLPAKFIEYSFKLGSRRLSNAPAPYLLLGTTSHLSTRQQHKRRLTLSIIFFTSCVQYWISVVLAPNALWMHSDSFFKLTSERRLPTFWKDKEVRCFLVPGTNLTFLAIL